MSSRSSVPSLAPEGAVNAPVFILGAPRSGTSLIYKALCLHPGAAYISNWVRRFPGLPALAALNRVGRHFPKLVESSWFERDGNAYVYGSTRSLVRRLFPMPVEGEPVFRRCGIAEDGFDSQSLDEPSISLRHTISRLRRFSGGQVFVSKRIANNRRIPLLVEAFPDARFVNTVRDGRAVAVSLAKVDWWSDSLIWWCGKTPRQWREDGSDPWELCAREWVENLREIDEGLHAVPPGQILHMTYEELVADPITTLKKLGQFAELPTCAAWEDWLSTLRFPNRNGAWTADLGPDIIQQIESIQREQLIRYGYLS